MTNFFAVRIPPGPGGDEFVELLNKLDSRYRISPDNDKHTKFMRSDPDSTETRSPQSSSPLLQNNVVVGGSVSNSNFSLLSQELRPLNAADILLGAVPGCSSSVLWSSGDLIVDSVVKKEELEEEYPLFTLNPPPQQTTNPLLKGADAQEEVDEGSSLDPGVVEDPVKKQGLDDEEFGKKKANKDAAADAFTVLVEDRLHQCKLCSAICPTAILMKHWSSHPLCSYCRQRFRSQEALSEHKRNHTVCDVCGKICPSVSKLKAHMLSHTGEKAFGCDFCEKSFKSKNALSIHVRNHTGERPYECPDCQKKFKSPSSFKNHRVIHSLLHRRVEHD